jgi:hypothetical protein
VFSWCAQGEGGASSGSQGGCWVSWKAERLSYGHLWKDWALGQQYLEEMQGCWMALYETSVCPLDRQESSTGGGGAGGAGPLFQSRPFALGLVGYILCIGSVPSELQKNISSEFYHYSISQICGSLFFRLC